jgi:hypothetical protein
MKVASGRFLNRVANSDSSCQIVRFKLDLSSFEFKKLFLNLFQVENLQVQVLHSILETAKNENDLL